MSGAPARAGALAPWVAAGPQLAITPELAGLALPSRRFPGPARPVDAPASWQAFRRNVGRWQIDPGRSEAAWRGAIDDARTRFEDDVMQGSAASDAILLALEAAKFDHLETGGPSPFTDLLVADKGLVHAVQVLLLMQRLQVDEFYVSYETTYAVHAALLKPVRLVAYCPTEFALREHLARAPLPIWETCLELMRAAAPHLPAWRRPLLAALMPDAPELANEVALLLQGGTDAVLQPWHEQNMWLCAYATSEAAIEVLHRWPRAQRTGADRLYGKRTMAATLLQDLGMRAQAILLEGADSGAGQQALACIGTPAAMAALATARRDYEDQFTFFYEAMQRWPDAALAALSESIAKDRCGPPRARRALAGVVAIHGSRVAALQPWVSPAAWKVLSTAAAQHLDMPAIAADVDLPAALVRPLERALIDEGPLDLHAAKIGKLPAFWKPCEWTRPVLASNGKALPDHALDTIGTMLGFPVADGVCPGLVQLRAACTPDSLADFAWDLFRAWVEHGAPAKSKWAYFALGVLGNDDSARALTPLIRAWPGESQHARAAAGLDILAMIGSDVALMLLNGIAQKLKFKGLQDRAREKIAAIAQERGLDPEQLDDYLAPDLGLDARGGMLLDFGPRQFRAGFDETLKPFVRDDAGTRLSDLPKPKKTDDAGLSSHAVARFKLLKKDARTVAAQQIMRLEMAMCTQRRWHPGTFRDLLADHPLVRHLVQRLVWGAYGEGDELLACFRVAPDGGLTDAGDNAFALPAGEHVRIGIVHALEMAPLDAAAFGQLFADYELVQPFAQIGRATYPMHDDERDSDGLWRWGDPVETTRLLGLAKRGWQRAAAEGGGSIREFTKRIGGGHLATLQFSPGLMAGNVDEFPQQTLGCLLVAQLDESGAMGERVTLASLGPVTVSELIRDMEQLRA